MREDVEGHGMSSVNARVMVHGWDESAISQATVTISKESDVHFTNPGGSLRLCASFLLLGPMGEPLHRPLLENVFLFFVLFFQAPYAIG